MNPFSETTVIVEVVFDPAFAEMFVGLAEMLKS